jgi:hypothetical protein
MERGRGRGGNVASYSRGFDIKYSRRVFDVEYRRVFARGGGGVNKRGTGLCILRGKAWSVSTRE